MAPRQRFARPLRLVRLPQPVQRFGQLRPLDRQRLPRGPLPRFARLELRRLSHRRMQVIIHQEFHVRLSTRLMPILLSPSKQPSLLRALSMCLLSPFLRNCRPKFKASPIILPKATIFSFSSHFLYFANSFPQVRLD